MVQELWAKLNPREKLVVYGAVAVAVGWLVGFLLATKNYCPGGSAFGISCNFNWFTAGTAGLFSMLALLLAIAGVVVLYLRYAPNMNVTWPMPFSQILLGIGGGAAACAVLVLLFQFTYGYSIGDAPIFMYLADLVLIAGGALMAWAAYQEWLVAKPNAPTTPPTNPPTQPPTV